MSVFVKPDLSGTVVDAVPYEATIVSVDFFNPGSAPTYVQFFDRKAADVVLGTTVPRDVFYLPAGGGKDAYLGEIAETHRVAVSIAATTTPHGSTAPVVPVFAKVYHR